jgi:predicted DNA-binding protein
MPTVKKRIQVPVADRVHEELKTLAKKRGLSISSLAHTLLEEALENQEDVYLSRVSDAALEEMERDNLVSHEDAWL